MADATLQILGLGTGAVPLDYNVTGNTSLDLVAVTADFDGTGAGASWLPAVQIISSAGHVMAESVGVAVSAGGSASVTFAPFLKSSTQTAAGGIQFGVENTGTFLHVSTTAARNDEILFTDHVGTGVLQIGNGNAILDGQVVTCAGSTTATFTGSVTTNIAGNTINIGVAGTAPAHKIIQTITDGGTGKIGFFGKAPAVRPATPVTLADVIAALQTLGLVT